MDEILDKYLTPEPVYYSVASSRVYAAVIGNSEDGLLLNISFEPLCKTPVPTDGVLTLRMGVVLRGIIRGKSHIKDFECQTMYGELRIPKCRYHFADVLSYSFVDNLNTLKATSFFSDLHTYLQKYGCVLDLKTLEDRLSYWIMNMKDKEVLSDKPFAFKF